MILTIDFNPSMDRIIDLDQINIGEYNYGSSSTYLAGGQGIMATSSLHAFNEEVFMTGFLGGFNGDYFHKHLLAKGLGHEFIPIKDETRTKVKLIDREKRTTLIYGESPRVTREDLRNFYELYIRLLDRSDLVVCIGDEPALGLPEDLYFNLIELAKARRKRIIIDIRSKIYKPTLEAIPYMLILDQEQMEDILGLRLDYDNEIVKAGKYILDKGIKYLAINLEDRGTIFLGQDKGYIMNLPENLKLERSKKDTSMAAGFALGFFRDYDMDMVLRIGQAFGLVSSLKDTRQVELADIKRLMGQIEIYPINY